MTLLYLGALVLLGLLCARIFRRFGLPAVTGYLVVGALAGPSSMHFVGESALLTLKPVAAFGLATIFFLLGEEFRVHELRRMGGKLLAVTVVQSVGTLVIVTALMLALHLPLPIALIFGAIAGTSDPAAALVVIRELRGRGELVRSMLSVVALNGFVELLLFSLLMPVIEVIHHGSSAHGVGALLRGPAYEFGGSLVLGLGLALVLRGWAMLPGAKGNLKAPTIGLILLGTGLCDALALSPMLAMLTFGAIVANVVPFRVHIFDVAKAMEGPLLVMFFTLAGANLHLLQLATLGAVGLAYAGGRITGKLSGAWLGGILSGSAVQVRRYVGCSLVPQASMAIGLAYVVQEKFPDLAGPVLPVVLGAVVVFEAVGPMLTRWSIVRAGEATALEHGHHEVPRVELAPVSATAEAVTHS